MKNSRRVVPVVMDTSNESLISSAGGSLLLATARATGLDRALCAGLAPWRAPRAVHDPGKVILDLAVALALGGDCLADVAVLRAQPTLFGAVASDPTVSRLVAALAADAEAALAAIGSARARARAASWSVRRPVAGGQVTIDLDATLVTAHSEKEHAAPTFKRGFGFHPLLAFADHGPGGTGEALAVLLRGGKATANNAADHITVLDAALAQLPEPARSAVLVRADSGGGTKAFLGHVTDLELQYSVGFYASTFVVDALAAMPRQAWRNAVNADGTGREGAQVAELTRWLPDMTAVGWPAGMRVIARRERPSPVRNSASPTPTVGASRSSRPTPPAGAWATSRPATGSGPAPRTASEGSRTPGCATCPCTTSPPTRSGASSCCSQPTCCPGPRPSPWPTPPPASGNPNDSGSACCTSPHAS